MSTDPAPAAPRVPGYEVGQRIGRGGSGTVWAATRMSDGAPVAVKVVAVGTDEQADVMAREFAVLARVDVEGLVGFHEAVGLVGEPASVALVLDHVEGGSLESVVRARGHLSVGESVTMLAPVARALAGLHGLGIVHGDVSPANVLLERTGRPLLADLGVASLAGEVPEQLYGTEGFVAPEVLDRGVVTTASDVYAVGALAWWCVTGSAPAPVALRRPLEELAPGLPPVWSEITRRALLGDPAARPTTAELALTYFDSAPCEPLRLVVGSDETSLLTQRLRQPGATTPPETAGPSSTAVTTLSGLVRRVGALMSALVRAAGTAGRITTAPRRAVALGTAALLVVGLVLGALVAWGHIASPDAAASADAATDHAGPQRDPHGLMVALSTLRAEVMASRSLTALARLDAPGSDALAQDRTLLRSLAASGQNWQGVALTVTSARTVSHTPERATIDAVVETAAYRVVDASGRVQQRPAVAGEELRFELSWAERRWRVESITSPGL